MPRCDQPTLPLTLTPYVLRLLPPASAPSRVHVQLRGIDTPHPHPRIAHPDVVAQAAACVVVGKQLGWADAAHPSGMPAPSLLLLLLLLWLLLLLLGRLLAPSAHAHTAHTAVAMLLLLLSCLLLEERELVVLRRLAVLLTGRRAAPNPGRCLRENENRRISYSGSRL